VLPRRYRYDVFLSYSHKESWPRWVDKIFLDVLRHWLGEELPRPVEIFRDVQIIRGGHNWLEELEIGLAESRIIVALWCRSYFMSKWCRRELAAMLARAQNFRERGIDDRIICPLVIHDSYRDVLPDLVRDMHVEAIDAYAEPFMTPESPRREQLSQAMKPICKPLARQIKGVRDESFAWPLVDYSDVLAKLDPPDSGPMSLPSLGDPE
jgi:hypothetical protein